jgi:hypothetical protein
MMAASLPREKGQHDGFLKGRPHNGYFSGKAK